MTTQKGSISVQSENIFPIIKRFLYSDQEIFLRELVSNAVDATTKLRTLSNKGEVQGELGQLQIEIKLDAEAKTLTISDMGIGMTADEVLKYLNQVAFSSAQEFMEKYQSEDAIIGHFGLGFYSAFMVAEKVEVRTKSYKDAPAVMWTCDGTPTYEMGEIEKETRGTDIVLYISEDAVEYLEKNRIEDLLQKYCRFLPVPIIFGYKTEYLDAEEENEIAEMEAEGGAVNAEGETEKPEGEKAPLEIEVPNQINDTAPIWKRNPADITEIEYLDFYQKLYPHSPEPLFWIHLNIDHPFNLTGVLYFPKLKNSMEVQQNKIQLYSNQVYVTDNVRDIVPEFLLLLHGIIDSPDIPLNVSRSYLQSDRQVKQITGYITKKVADKIGDLFKKDRADFEVKWKDIGVFIKYGLLSDEKFADKAKDFVLLSNLDHKLFTLDEYREKVQAAQTDKEGKLTYLYTQHADAHYTYTQAAKQRGYDVLLMDAVLDNHFLQFVEGKEDKLSFKRVDSDTIDNLIVKDFKLELVISDAEKAQVETVLKSVVDADADVQIKPLSPEDSPLQIVRPEFMRRMKEMQALQGGNDMWSNFPERYQVIVNGNHPLVAKKLATLADQEEAAILGKYLYQLAQLNQGMLKGAALNAFVEQSLQRL